MDRESMQKVARALVAPGKGILAADESLPTIEKRFKSVGVASTEENRQSDVEATERLNAMNQRGKAPWGLSFSFGRALQAPALDAWKGRPENVSIAQAALLHRARCNGAARSGSYSPEGRP
jgi:fructose-bisphosphate aldolase class 1